MNRYAHIANCCAIFAIAIGGLSAETTRGSYQLPSDTEVIGYLLQSMNWYRHVYTERQVASDPGDLVFLNDNQAIESQIVKLSFEFAKADVALANLATSPHDAPATGGGSVSADLAHFIELKNRNDQVTQQTSVDIGKLNARLIQRAIHDPYQMLCMPLADHVRCLPQHRIPAAVIDRSSAIHTCGVERQYDHGIYFRINRS